MLSSLRNFFLALFFSLIVFGISAYFFVGYVQTQVEEGLYNPTTELPDNTEATVNNSIVEENHASGEVSVFNALLVGIDDGQSQSDEKKEADTIIIFNINSNTKTLTVSPLSCDMKVEVKGYTMRLGAVYADYGINVLLEVVKANTGLKMDYYCAFNYKSIESLFDILGEVEYNVPMDMYYKPDLYDTESEENSDPEREPEIDLKSGRQLIDGKKAVQILRYKGYSSGNTGRVSTQMEFLKEVIRQKITLENFSKAKEIYYAIKNSVESTNIDEKSFDNYTDLIFSVSTAYQTVDLVYPGDIRSENGVIFFIPNVLDALKQYKEYRKPVTAQSATTEVATNADISATEAETETTG